MCLATFVGPPDMAQTTSLQTSEAFHDELGPIGLRLTYEALLVYVSRTDLSLRARS